jgi:hypothetical protein
MDITATIGKTTVKWYNEYNELHNTYDAAIIHASGKREYYINGKRHKEYGPAVVKPNGKDEYWLYGKQLPKDVFYARQFPMKQKVSQKRFISLID